MFSGMWLRIGEAMGPFGCGGEGGNKFDSDHFHDR